MLTLQTKLDHADRIDGDISLTFEMREKNRLRARLTSGEEIAIATPRGTVLRNGDLLRGNDGRVVRILAAKEATYRVECDTLRDLLRCAFHLGRHGAQVHIGNVGSYGYLRMRHDPSLRDMLEALGATVIGEHAAFEPEVADPDIEPEACPETEQVRSDGLPSSQRATRPAAHS